MFYLEQAASENPTFYGELEEPQSLNKYHYALNNPLRYVDPDGHQAMADTLKIATVGGAATGQPEIAAGAGAALLIYVVVDKTVGWDKVGQKFTEVFSGSGPGCLAGSCGSLTFNKSNEQGKSSDGNQQVQGQNGSQASEKVAPDQRAKPPSTKQREEVYNKNKEKNNGKLKCDICGTEMGRAKKDTKGVTPKPNSASVDHITPRSRGGSSDPSNLRGACRKCNRDKGDKP